MNAPLASFTAPGAAVVVVHSSPRPIDLRATLGPLRRGTADPCHRELPDGSLWRTSLMDSGPVTYRLRSLDERRVECRAWGEGSDELARTLPDLLGEGDDVPLVTDHPLLVQALRRLPGLRIPRTRRVLEALVPAVIEQKVTGVEARRGWRHLVHRYGRPAPGPAPEGMRVPPSARAWALVPSWEFHLAGIDPKRAATVVACARVAPQLEACATLSLEAAHRRLRSVPGVGEWTAAEVAVRALGDTDALSVGDYHIAGMVGWTFAGRPFTDPEMVEYLAPWRPHRGRVIRLLEASGLGFKPRFGPRMTIADHRRH